MEKLQQNYPVEIQWHSFELRPADSPPMSPAHKARIEESRPRFQQMAREQYGMEVNQGPFGIDSRPALIAEKFAEEQGKGEAFHKAVMDAYWQHARSIDDTVLLKEIAANVGLDTEHFDDVLQNLTYDEQVTADVELAHAYRLNGVPALIFANKYLVSGAQPYNVLKQVVERVLAEEGSEP